MTKSSNKLIAKNTMLLYIRMILVMGVTLYTSRVILNALGFQDYGLYNVIGGFVALFSIISGSLSAAISRFITYELGTENKDRLKQIFSCSNIIQLILCGIIIVISLTAGVWFISYKMKIPSGDYVSAYWVFAFSIASFCLNLLSIPYNAAIIAHEKMNVFSYMSILEVTLKLVVAYSITLFANNRLIIYAFLLFAVSTIIRFVYVIYCKRHFEECSASLVFDKKITKEIGKFAGWNFIGASSSVLRSQGNNVVLNLFYGTVINAAYGISMQVNSAVNQLSSNFMTAVNPQITKLYASGELYEMNKLIIRSSKISFFLCWILSIIILINTPYILKVWLDNVPEYTVIFVDLVLLMLLSESISKSLITAMLATGNIRDYQMLVGGLQMLNLPLSYIALKMGYEPPCVMIIAIMISQICFAARLYMLRGMIKIKVRKFLTDVYFRCLFVAILSYVITMTITHYIKGLNFGILIVESLMALSFSTIFIFWIGFDRSERTYILGIVKSITRKNTNR